MNKISEFSAQMICYLWFAEPSSTRIPFQHSPSPLRPSPTSSSTTSPPTPSSSPPNITQAQLVPNPEFVIFIHNLLHTTQVSHSVVLLALFYIHRLKSLNSIKPNSKSEYRIGVVSLMLANKMLDDHTYTAKTWSEVSRLPITSLNDGEIEFLKGLNFELHVNLCDFSAWFKLLHGMVHLKDRHTAIALASGPRTRWFKKMRVASGEGLNVLEGLISPIRNSKIMKSLELQNEQTFRTPPPPPPPHEHFEVPPSAGFQSHPARIRPQPPPHPYNLRKSTRSIVVSSTHTTPIQQFPSWQVSPASVSSAYSTIVPCNHLSMTPQQQLDLRDRQITSLPPKTRMMQFPIDGYPTRVQPSSSKRNLAEFLSQQDSVFPSDGLNVYNPRNKRFSSSNSTCTTTASSSSSQVPSAAPTILTTPGSQQLIHHHLAPIMTTSHGTTHGTTHGTYLANAILPSQQHHHHPFDNSNHNENRPKLYFRSIVAGRRGETEQVVVAQQENGLSSYTVGNNPSFVMGKTTSVPSSEHVHQVEMSNNKRRVNRADWSFSNFSNAGVPGVVWADRAANLNQNIRNDRFTTVPSQLQSQYNGHSQHFHNNHPQVNFSSSNPLWRPNDQQLQQPF